ncbi:MAG TPA: hypothetical protein VGF98_02240 [Candidatus Tumulicola sp.]|jgi:hypothetical protein
MAILDEREIELKKIAAQLTASMLDNHNGDWDETATANAFKTIYEAVKSA